MYRCLYEDGTMILSGSPITPDERKVVMNGECEQPTQYISSKNIKVVIFETKVKPINCSSWFCNFFDLQEIQNIHLLDTSECTNMSDMFANCSSLTSLDVSSFNTSKVKDMSYMFYNCKSLEKLDLSSFNTSNVENMYGMFYNCENLKNLDLNNFDMVNVYDTNFMFEGCKLLQEVHLCETLKRIDKYLFLECENLKRIEWKNHIYTLEDLKEYEFISI